MDEGFACGNVYNGPRFRTISLPTIRRTRWRGDGSKCTSMINMLVDNEENEAGLEMTIMGPKLLIKKTTLLAIGGADMEPLLNGERIPLWRPILAEEGSMLCFGKVKSGCRSVCDFCRWYTY